MRHREGNGTPFRHSEAVTDVTAVGIFPLALKRGGTSSEIATPACALVRNDRREVKIASHREGHFHLERVCSTVAPYTRGTLPTILPESKI